MATKLDSKWAKSANSPSFVTLAFQNGLEYRISDFKKTNGDDLATVHANLDRFSPVKPGFKRVVSVEPLVNQQCGFD